MTTTITRRTAIAAMALAALPTVAMADAPAFERKPVEETPLFVSDLLNWEGTTDEEWQTINEVAFRFLMSDADAAEKLLASRAAMVAKPAENGVEFWVSTAAGTTQDGNVPKVDTHGASLIQLGVNVKNGGGKSYDVRFDGEKVAEIQAADMSQGSATLEGDMLALGEHVFDLVLDGDVVASATIEFVG